VAACEAAKEAVWLKRLMKNAMPEWDESIPVMCDNQSTIQLIRNPVFHQRTKHIDVKYYFVRERQEAGDIYVSYISTNDQLADPLTKILPNPRFSSLRELMGILPVPLYRQGTTNFSSYSIDQKETYISSKDTQTALRPTR
jgi:hypothetical protein